MDTKSSGTNRNSFHTNRLNPRRVLLSSVAAFCVVASQALAGPNSTSVPTRLSAMDAEVNPFYGKINPFYGKINPFYGKISPFWGKIAPFWGKINPFYGKITPFYGDTHPFWGKISPFYGKINPFWATVQPFWHDMGPFWGDLNAQWGQLQDTNSSDYAGLQAGFQNFLSQSEAFWGPAVQEATKKSFMDGFAQKLLTQYGIDPSSPSSLAAISPETRSEFFLAWYDGLMSFTGVDHVDWWMSAVHWTPMITQIQGSGHDSIIGLLDSSVSSKDESIEHLEFRGGFKSYTNGHGAAVASLMSASHDGEGIMGIAPEASVKLYNPFDETGTAGWSDVQQGIFKLYADGAYVINLSLGVPGWTLSSEWANILTSPSLDNHKHDIVFVKAAGNEGVVQTTNIAWIGNQAPDNLIIVGSVSPTGELSSFSNTPGEACILTGSACREENKLKYDFMVAPGELILVSDNNGGITRMTGTSFAAPLVSGAVALLQDRWPWLQKHAKETVQIMLRSADDLGAPGVDPVYGWGMLNVEASQSPLDFNNLVVYQPTAYRDGLDYKTASRATWTPASLRSAILSSGQLGLWQQQGAFLVAFEPIGGTYRDFSIPLSSALVDKTLKSNGASNQFQSYIYQRLIDWSHRSGFTDFNTRTAEMAQGAWDFSMTASAPSASETRRDEKPFHSEFLASNRASGVELRMGEGNGARAFARSSGFGFSSDFDPATGGVNPILGFASGGAYAGGAVSFAPGARLTMGFSQQSDDHSTLDPVLGVQKNSLGFSPYEASASVIGIDYELGRRYTVNVAYTHLDEASGLLGAQGRGALGLAGGAGTDAWTWGARADLPGEIEVMGSATFAETSPTQFAASALSVANGLRSTAYEVAALKTGLFRKSDHVRFSLAQPLHVESGALQYSSLGVVNRDTGELGVVNQSWNIASGDREYRAEMVYAAPILDGRAEVSGFGLMDVNAPTQAYQSQEATIGGRIRFSL